MEPSMYRDTIEGYNTIVKDVIEKDTEGAAFEKFKFGELNEDEKKLNDAMASVRSQYRERYEKMARPYPPIEPFNRMKQEISGGKLYQEVFRKMPKGGLLHVHSAAGLSVDGLFRLIQQWNGVYKKEPSYHILVVTKKNDEYPNVELGTLLYRKQAQLEQAKTGKKTSLEAYSEMADKFLAEEGNQEWMKELLSFGEYGTRQYYYRWDYFNIIFSRTARLFRNEAFYKEYHVRFFLECMDDNIPYVELRCGFEEFEHFDSLDDSDVAGGQEKKDLTMTEKLALDPDCTAANYVYRKEMSLAVAPWDPLAEVPFLDKIKEAVESANEIGVRNGKSIAVKVILCARRSLDPNDAQQKASLLKKLDSAIVIMRQDNYKDFVIGFDFVSEEDRGQATSEYAEKIIYSEFGSGYEGLTEEQKQRLQGLIEKYGLDNPRLQLIDFYLHDGESSWNSNNNVISAAAVSRYRIGHGFNMGKHPGCVRTITTNDGSINAGPRLPILEICPISNQMLGYYPDLRTHSAYELMRQGVICCIANDDPQIFGNEGVSYDLWEAYMAWDIDLRDIKTVIYASYYFYCLRVLPVEKEDAKILESFDGYWSGFVREANSAFQSSSELL